MTRMHNPPHPGGIIKEAIADLKMTVTEFADHIGVSRVTLSRVVNEKAGITPIMSIKLAQAFGQPSLDIWFKVQGDHDFWVASQAKLKAVKPLKRAA
jgi:antitoxin HigA-1